MKQTKYIATLLVLLVIMTVVAVFAVVGSNAYDDMYTDNAPQWENTVEVYIVSDFAELTFPDLNLNTLGEYYKTVQLGYVHTYN